jgi:hypothetical protein
MDRDEFEYAVRARAPKLAPQALDLAIGHYLSYWPRLDKGAVNSCIMLAGLWDQSLSNATPTATSTVAGPSAPSAAIGSHELARRIFPQIQEIRQKFFARADPPFSSWPNAEGWLREAGEKPVFEEACQALAEVTGFPLSDVERYALVGLAPFLSHCEVLIQKLPYRTRGVIHFEWGFTDTDLRRGGQIVRKGLGISRLKGLNKRDQLLLDLIQQVGDPPSISDPAYWERLRRLANANTSVKPFDSAKAVEMAYRRIPEKVHRSLPAHPATPTKRS